MDVPQIYIKINQTNKTDAGKASLKDPKVNAFEQIVNKVKKLIEQSDNNQSSGSPLNNGKEVTDPSTTSDSQSTNDSDWEQLDNILSLLISTLQSPVIQQALTEQPKNEEVQTQLQLPDTEIQTNPDSLLSIIEAQIGEPSILSQSIDTGMAVADQMKRLPVVNELIQQLQKSATVSLDKDQMSVDLSKMLNEDQNGHLSLPDKIRDKIQTLVNQLQTTTKVQMSEISEPLMMNLDKNQVMIHKDIQSLSSARPVLNSSNKEEISHSNGLPAVAGHVMQGYGVRNIESQVKQTPVVTVSELGPEVSAMAAKLVRISDGNSGKSEAVFSLYPQHLGHVEVKIFSQAGQISAQIIAGTSQAKEALEGQLQHLRAALIQQGLEVEKLDVVQQTPQTSGNNLAFSQGGSTFSQQQSFVAKQGTSKKQDNSDQTDFEIETLPTAYRGAVPNKASHIDFTA